MLSDTQIVAQTAASVNPPATTQADIIRVLGAFCLITLDNGDEAFYVHGQWVTGADGASNEPTIGDLARRMARAAGQSLRCVDLPVPDDKEWCWSDVVEALVRAAGTREVRSSLIMSEIRSAKGRAVHFCSDPLLSGSNCNLWFPLAEDEDLFAGVERILTINGVAENVARITPVRDGGNYTDWRVIFNLKVTA
ncbi:hypothetical protein ACQPT2_21220 [Erwinia amylovora]